MKSLQKKKVIMKKAVVFCVLSFYSICTAGASDLKVAVASNFITPMKKLSEAFERETGNHIVISSGSSGKLTAQIREGAPFEVFLSADQEGPRQIITTHQGVDGSQFTYSIGQLVLWSPRENFIDSNANILRSKSFFHLAIANSRLAPYGKAAQETLEKLGMWKALEKKIVYGENIAQTFQFVVSGNSELGFVSFSQIVEEGKVKGSHWLVPQHYYTAIRQDAILLEKGKNNPVAKQFLDFLKSEKSSLIITSFGYKRL